MSGDWPPGGANEEVARDRAGANSKEEAKDCGRCLFSRQAPPVFAACISGYKHS